MKVFRVTAPNIIQPIFTFNQWSRKPICLMDNVSRWRSMAADMNLSTKALLRLEWMIFFETAGNKDAYQTAKHFAITPKTFYKWHKRFDNGLIDRLEDESKAPINKRKWTVTIEQQSRIKKLRNNKIHYGKNKLKKLYEDEYGETISTWKIEIVIRHFGLYPDKEKQEKIRSKLKNQIKKNRIQKLDIIDEHWFLFHLDTIVIYWGSAKRYILTAIDHHGKIAYARSYKNKSSRSAKDFLYRLHYLIDANIANVQTDNGSEFYGEFDQALSELEIMHWFSRNHTPKDNSVCERFNQTLQHEWLNDGNFTTDCNELNRKLTEWLVEYNFDRPHQALDYQTPFGYYENTLTSNKNLLPMYSARTNA
jgi:transposase